MNEVSDQVVGLGPIEALIRDPEISEVMVNGPHDIYVERKGRLERVTDVLFEGEEDVLHVIERIVAPLGLRVDESSPSADARLSDGSRVHAIIPPLSLRVIGNSCPSRRLPGPRHGPRAAACCPPISRLPPRGDERRYRGVLR